MGAQRSLLGLGATALAAVSFAAKAKEGMEAKEKAQKNYELAVQQKQENINLTKARIAEVEARTANVEALNKAKIENTEAKTAAILGNTENSQNIANAKVDAINAKASIDKAKAKKINAETKQINSKTALNAANTDLKTARTAQINAQVERMAKLAEEPAKEAPITAENSETNIEVDEDVKKLQEVKANIEKHNIPEVAKTEEPAEEVEKQAKEDNEIKLLTGGVPNENNRAWGSTMSQGEVEAQQDEWKRQDKESEDKRFNSFPKETQDWINLTKKDKLAADINNWTAINKRADYFDKMLKLAKDNPEEIINLQKAEETFNAREERRKQAEETNSWNPFPNNSLESVKQEFIERATKELKNDNKNYWDNSPISKKDYKDIDKKIKYRDEINNAVAELKEAVDTARNSEENKQLADIRNKISSLEYNRNNRTEYLDEKQAKLNSRKRWLEEAEKQGYGEIEFADKWSDKNYGYTKFWKEKVDLDTYKKWLAGNDYDLFKMLSTDTQRYATASTLDHLGDKSINIDILKERIKDNDYDKKIAELENEIQEDYNKIVDYNKQLKELEQPLAEATEAYKNSESYKALQEKRVNLVKSLQKQYDELKSKYKVWEDKENK